MIDYVIVHELMHIKEKNHSARFWKLMEAVMPEYKMHRRWLKEKSTNLFFDPLMKKGFNKIYLWKN